MAPAFYTFQEIIKYNSHDWDLAYDVLQYHIQEKNLIKEIRGPEDIIYLNVGKVEPFDMIHTRIFIEASEKSTKRPRIKRDFKEDY